MSSIPSKNKTIHDQHYFELPFSNLTLQESLRNVTQKPGFIVDYEFNGYRDLTDNAICLVLWAYFTINPSIQYNDVGYKALSIYEFNHSMTPYFGKTQPFTDQQNRVIDLSLSQPNSVNSQSQVTNSVDVMHTVTFSANGSVGFMMGDPMGSLGLGYSDTRSNGYSKTVTQNVSDWAILETSAPAESPASASWLHHQKYPYDIYTLGPENFSTWWKEAYSNTDKRPNPLKDLPDLSISTMKIAANASWRIPASIISSLPSKTLWIYVTRAMSLASIANNKYSDNDHNRLSAEKVFSSNCLPFELDELLANTD